MIIEDQWFSSMCPTILCPETQPRCWLDFMKDSHSPCIIFFNLNYAPSTSFSLYLTRQWQSKHISTKCAISMGIESALVNLKFSFLLTIWYFISHVDLNRPTCLQSWERAYGDQNSPLSICESIQLWGKTPLRFLHFLLFHLNEF